MSITRAELQSAEIIDRLAYTHQRRLNQMPESQTQGLGILGSRVILPSFDASSVPGRMNPSERYGRRVFFLLSGKFINERVDIAELESPKLLNSRLSRRGLLQIGMISGGLVLAGALNHNDAEIAEASGIRPWTSMHWFPAYPNLDPKHAHLPTLASALATFSPEAANWHMANVSYQKTADAGECPSLAAIGILDEVGPSDRKKAEKVAPLVALGRPAVALPVDQADDVGKLLSLGNKLAVDAPEEAGTWVRVAYDISTDGKMIAVTAWGAEVAEPHWVPYSLIRSAWKIIHYNDPRANIPRFVAAANPVNPHLDPRNSAHVAAAQQFARAA